jgi:hypothetical protein
MKIRLAYTIEVDYDEWSFSYGTSKEDFREDVKSYFWNLLIECPAAEETGCTITQRD